MVNKISVKVFASYKAHTINGKGVVKLTVGTEYADLADSIKLLQLLNNDVTVKVKIGYEKVPFKLGVFKIDKFAVDRDGNAKIVFSSLTDYVEVEALAKLISVDESVFTLRCDADVEVEEVATEES